MKTGLEFLKDNIAKSNIPEEHYEWEIAEMMEDYANYYHTHMIMHIIVFVMHIITFLLLHIFSSYNIICVALCI
jgi:hypothetical protein